MSKPKVSKNIDTDLVKRTFLTAFESRGHPKDLTFHSDYAEENTMPKNRWNFAAWRSDLSFFGIVFTYT